jgi:hypothetical protein
VNIRSPHFGLVADLARSLAFYATASDVRDVIAKGEWLLRDRTPHRVDREEILDRACIEASRALEGVDVRHFSRDRSS